MAAYSILQVPAVLQRMVSLAYSAQQPRISGMQFCAKTPAMLLLCNSECPTVWLQAVNTIHKTNNECQVEFG